MDAQEVNLGKKIRFIRQMQGMKQEVLAAKMGVSQQSISKMERSKKVSDKKIQQLSEIFEMAMDNIKNFDEENTIQNNFALRDRDHNHAFQDKTKIPILKGMSVKVALNSFWKRVILIGPRLRREINEYYNSFFSAGRLQRG